MKNLKEKKINRNFTIVLLGIFLLLALIFFAIDYLRIQKQEKPIFCILKDEVNDGGTKIYLGLGYKIIDFNTLEGFDDIKIGTWFIDYNDFGKERKFEEELQKNENNIESVVFKAKIKEIRKYNEITTILIEGLDSNDLNYRGEYDFSVDKDTELLWNETKIELSDLKEGKNVLITSTGEILERYPAGLTKVTKVVILDENL